MDILLPPPLILARINASRKLEEAVISRREAKPPPKIFSTPLCRQLHRDFVVGSVADRDTLHRNGKIAWSADT